MNISFEFMHQKVYNNELRLITLPKSTVLRAESVRTQALKLYYISMAKTAR